MLCKNCNQKIPNGSIFCNYCGNRTSDKSDELTNDGSFIDIVETEMEEIAKAEIDEINNKITNSEDINDNFDVLIIAQKKKAYIKAKESIINSKVIQLLKRHKNRNIIILLSILIFTMLIINLGTDFKLLYWRITKNNDKVLYYFEDNYIWEDKSKYILKSMDILMELNSDTTFDKFQDILWNSQLPKNIRSEILNRYIHSESRRPKINIVMDVLYKRDFEFSQLKPLLDKYKETEIISAILEHYKTLIENKDWNNLYKDMGITIKNNIYKNDELSKLYEELSKLIEINNRKADTTVKVYDLENKYNEKQKDYETNIKPPVDQAKLQRNDKKKIYESAEMKYTSDKYREMSLEFYIIAYCGEPITGVYMYEVSPVAYNYYGYKTVSSDRAILYTDKKYTNKGWENVQVFEEGTENITIKEELGGFEQDWPFYVEKTLYNKSIGLKYSDAFEVAKKEFNDSEENVRKLDKKESEALKVLDDLKKEKEKYSNELKTINNQYKTLEKSIKGKINNLLAEETDLEMLEVEKDNNKNEDFKKESIEEKREIDRRIFDKEDLQFSKIELGVTKISDIIRNFGNPKNIEYQIYEYDEVYERIYEYNDINFVFKSFNLGRRDEDYMLMGCEIFNNNIVGPRGIKVGDKINDVLLNFPKDENNDINEQGINYLYGKEYDHNGRIFYNSNKELGRIELTYYIDTSFGYIMEIKAINDRVDTLRIEILVH